MWRQPADREVVEAVLSCFRDERDLAAARLRKLTERQWLRSLFWIDAAGMSLYLHDRLLRMKLTDLLPPRVTERWVHNKAQNAERCESLFGEMCAINSRFAEEGICFANVKGFTLLRNGCADLTLRLQLDLDLSVALADVESAHVLLSGMGYRLTGSTDRVHEYKRGSVDLTSGDDRYKAPKSFCVEVHFDPHGGNNALDRTVLHTFAGFDFPGYSDVDVFLGQAMHLLSHLLGPTTRLSWLLEFGRNAMQHQGQQCFWTEVAERADRIPEAGSALALSAYLSGTVLGRALPQELDRWNQSVLDAGVLRWVQKYGRTALLADFPGTKLFLILRGELRRGEPGERQQKLQRLLPRRLAPGITTKVTQQTFRRALRNWAIEIRFLMFRSRFHLVEGLRYLVHAWMWTLEERRLNKQTAPSVTAQLSCGDEVLP